MNELVRWDPFRAVLPFEGSLFGRAWSGPRMDVQETDTAYELAVELPGVKKEAIEVSVYENTVTIAGEITANGEEQNWLLRERSYGKFSRNIALPEAVDEDSSQARYADGVLYLTLQKKRATQVKRLTVH
jgi:HSP20 family protein